MVIVIIVRNNVGIGGVRDVDKGGVRQRCQSCACSDSGEMAWLQRMRRYIYGFPKYQSAKTPLQSLNIIALKYRTVHATLREPLVAMTHLWYLCCLAEAHEGPSIKCHNCICACEMPRCHCNLAGSRPIVC